MLVEMTQVARLLARALTVVPFYKGMSLLTQTIPSPAFCEQMKVECTAAPPLSADSSKSTTRVQVWLENVPHASVQTQKGLTYYSIGLPAVWAATMVKSGVATFILAGSEESKAA